MQVDKVLSMQVKMQQCVPIKTRQSVVVKQSSQAKNYQKGTLPKGNKGTIS